MKNIRKYLCLYGLLILCSCSNNTEFPETDNESGKFRVGSTLFSVDGMSSDNFMQLYTLSIDQNSDEFDYNLLMKRSSGSSDWKAYFNTDEEKEADVLEWDGSSNASVVAVFNNNVAIPDLKSSLNMKVTEGQQTAATMQADDVLYYTDSHSPETDGDVIDIRFEHLLCKVSIQFDLNKLEKEGLKVKSVEITDVMTDYSWIPSNGTKNLKPAGELKSIGLSMLSENLYEGIFVPQTLSSTSKLIIRFMSGDKETVNEESFQKGAKLISGSRYAISGIDFVSSSSNQSRAGHSGDLILSADEWKF